MKNIIRLSESELKNLIKKIILESNELSLDDWESIWFKLRKINKSFGVPSDDVFNFGGLFFHYSRKNGNLFLPPQKLSEWRDDLGEAAEILNNYVKRLRKFFEESELGLTLEVNEDYSMIITKD